MTGQNVTYQVTADGEVVAEFTNGYDATIFATRLFTTCGLGLTVKRSESGRPEPDDITCASADED